MIRQEGYYWVKRANEWRIMYFRDSEWYEGYEPIDIFHPFFDEIDEHRILTPDEAKAK